MIRFKEVVPGKLLVPEGMSLESEVVGRRTARAKTFAMGNNQFRVRAGIAPVHYHDGERWQEVDLTVVERGGELVCDTAGYEARMDMETPGVVIDSALGEGELSLADIEGMNRKAKGWRIEGNEVVWEYNKDLTIHAELRPRAVEFYKVLGSDKSPRRFEWQVGKATRQVRLKGKSAGKDAKKRNVQMETALEGDRYVEEWTGMVGVVTDPKTRVKAWKAEAEYPVVVDASVVVGVSADADDATGYYGGGFGTNFICKTYADHYTHGGLRFQELAIPQGATILGATILVTPYAAAYGSDCVVYGDLTGDAHVWSAYSIPDPTNINKSLSKFTLPATIVTNKVLPISATNIVQSIINLTGWSSNNDVRFLFEQKGGKAQMYFIDYPDVGFSILDVVYTTEAGGGGGRRPRIRRHGV